MWGSRGSWTQKQLNRREALGTLGFFEEELEPEGVQLFYSTPKWGVCFLCGRIPCGMRGSEVKGLTYKGVSPCQAC